MVADLRKEAAKSCSSHQCCGWDQRHPIICINVYQVMDTRRQTLNHLCQRRSGSQPRSVIYGISNAVPSRLEVLSRAGE